MTYTYEKEEGVHLTNKISLSAGCHIVYTYSEIEYYLNNAVAFIAEGIDQEQRVIYIDQPLRFTIIKDKLKRLGYLDKQINEIIFEDSLDFYQANDLFSIQRILNNFSNLLQPYLQEKKTVRTWADVRWNENDHESLLTDLTLYECECDSYIEKLRTISVCAYNGFTLPASYLSEILRAHEYHMTDKTIVPSSFYKKKTVLFPSISEQFTFEKETQNQLIRSEKLSIAGQLAAGIAHEIRNPLTAVKGFLQLMEEDEQNRTYIKIIKEEINKIEQISSEMLVLSKPHLEKRMKQDIVQLIEEVKILMEPHAIHKNIGIHSVYCTNEINVLCDEMKIKQVLINLVKNAIEAMEKGYITINAKKTVQSVIINIADEGPGISEETLTQLGKPFFTTKEKGTGLGLLICYRIIENHNGEMSVESQKGKGTTFTIELPLD